MNSNLPEPLVIAELACTHNGDLDRALALVDAAHSTGADAVKFQIFRAEDICAPSHPDFEIFTKLAFDQSEWKKIIARARERQMFVFADVFSLETLQFCQEMEVNGYKIHSSDLANHSLLSEVAQHPGPVLLGIGGSSLFDIDSALEVFHRAGHQDVIPMLGHQAFPTPPEECQLHKIAWFRDALGMGIGYADHIDGGLPLAIETPALAAALGAAIIEKHITINRDEKPEDFEASLDPEKFQEMVLRIRRTKLLLGNPLPSFSENEKSYARKMKKHPCARENLALGEKVADEKINYLRVSSSTLLRPLKPSEYENRRLIQPVKQNEPLSWSHLEQKTVALVNARLLSRRLPKKALMPLAGKPALQWLFDRIKTCRSIDQTILCITQDASDDELEAFGDSLGVPVYRGETDDVMARLIGAARKFGADHIVRITGDDILSDPHYIDLAVKAHLENNADYTAVNGLPVGLDREVIHVCALEWIHARARDKSMTEYMTWYLDDPFRLAVQTLQTEEKHFFPEGRLTLDKQTDFNLIDALLRELSPAGDHLSTEAIIAYLKKQPKIPAQTESKAPSITRGSIDTSLYLRKSN